MTSSEKGHEQAVKQEAFEGLVEAVQQKDVLFVLYHLKQLDASSINRKDPFSQLTPLKVALSHPSSCPRRALIVELLLLSGASLTVQHDANRSTAGPSEAVNAQSTRGSQEEADAEMLLHNLPLEQAEVWLRRNGLDVPEAYDNPTDQRKDSGQQACSRRRHGSDDVHWLTGGPPQASPKRPRLSLPEETSSNRDAFRAERPSQRRHSHSSPRPPRPSKISKFIIDCLASQTTPSALERFLATSLRSTSLIDSVSPTFSSGANACLVTLTTPIASEEILNLDNRSLDGARLRVLIDDSRKTSAFASSPLHYSQHRPSSHNDDYRDSTSSQHSRRAISQSAQATRPRARRSISPPSRQGRPTSPSPPWWDQDRQARIWAPYSSCYYAYEGDYRGPRPVSPAQGAPQVDLDRWAQESWVGRWASDYPGVPPFWNPRPGAVWRGKLCYQFPPVAGVTRDACWGRDCNFAHAWEELRWADGSLKYPEAAADFAKRPWTAPTRQGAPLLAPNGQHHLPQKPQRAHQPSLTPLGALQLAEASEQPFGDGQAARSKPSAVDWLL